MLKNRRNFFLRSKSKGLTLIEVLVVASLIVFMTTLLLRNFSGSKLNLERIANIFAADLRLAQQLAISSHQFQGSTDPAPRNRCGYGITKPGGTGSEGNQAADCSDNIDNDSDGTTDSFDAGCDRLYYVYAGPPTVKPDGTANNCGSASYQQSQDYPFYKTVVLDSRVDFVDNPGFRDIFYAPPWPTTYIQNSTSPSNLDDDTTYYEVVTIKKSGVTKQQCNSGSLDCVYVCVYFSGRIEVARNSSSSTKCPAPY